MPNLGPEYDFAARLRRLEQLVGLIAGNPLGQAFSSTQSDGSVGISITQNAQGNRATALQFYQGPTTSRDANTGLHPVLMYIGQLWSNGQPVNSGIIMYRPNGRQIATFGDGGPALFDAAGNRMLTTDETAGWGIQDPWIPLPTPVPSGLSSWPSTAATAWTTIASSNAYIQHAKIRWNGWGYAPSGVTGQFRLLVNGQQYGQVWSATNQYTAIAEDIALPAGNQWLNGYEVDLQAQVTAGTGTVSGQVYGVYGRGT